MFIHKVHLELIAFLCTEKVRILTVLPATWTIARIEHEFKAPRKLISLVKSVAKSKVDCAAPDQRLKKQFDPEKNSRNR
jgi:hypothetical protein